MKQIIVNLDLPPNKRWEFMSNYRKEINALIKCYLHEINDIELIPLYLEKYKKDKISTSYLEEIKTIAANCDFTEDEVLLANLYYDAVKFAFGCTAFASKSTNGIWHARNLDWWTEDNLLSKHSVILDYQKNGKSIFKTVGWLGYIGALSGVKVGKFSITLNAVLSEEEPAFEAPISFLLRDILENAPDFKAAKEILELTPIACDCLLLLSGVEENEMVVIERTPKNSRTRKAKDNYIIVTNDYKSFASSGLNENVLQQTSCKRYDKTEALLNQNAPNSVQGCFDIISNQDIKMNITVQQMVFNVKQGVIELKI